MQIAAALAGAEKVEVLLAVIRAAALAAPTRIGWLSAEAETAARSIQDPIHRAVLLSSLAAAVAGSDPDRAEAIARSIEGEDWREHALSGVAGVVMESDPDRAEAIARSIEDRSSRAAALADLVFLAAQSGRDRPGS